MKTYNFIYNQSNFTNDIDLLSLKDEPNVLVQIFCGQGESVLKEAIDFILSKLPQAICLGTTTDGEIINDTVTTFQTVVSISIFEKTELKTAHCTLHSSFETGKELAKRLVEENTKLLILFTDGIHMNAEEFLKGVTSLYPNIPVCGGMAGDNGEFVKTFISSSKTILNKGAVGVSLNSDILKIVTDYKFDWKGIGLEHTIDEVDGNRIYKIDGMSPIDFYDKYLGSNFSKTEFPLILQQEGIPKARAVIAKHEDGSLSCGGNLQKGDKVKIGFGDAQSLLKSPIESLKNLHQIKAQTFFVYSCMARRRYMPNLINLQAAPFANLASTSGFFTYAEFFHSNGHNELLNQTLTAVALSEEEDKNGYEVGQSKKMSLKDEAYVKTIQSLTHLIGQSTKDYEAQSKELEEQNLYKKNLLESHRQFLRHTVHEMNLPLSVIMNNIELHELENGKSVYLENIEVGLKSIFSLYDDLSYLVRRDQISYFKRRLDLVDFIRGRIDFFERVASKAKSKFVFKSSQQEAYVYFNETKLQRVIDNNLTNAIKYTFENKDIEVEVRVNEEDIFFSIASYSKKIQEPKMIFEEYYREERAKDGFGLGLNLVKRICVEEGVSIEVISNEEVTKFIYGFKEDRR
jgi:signal transduction histidine kinase